MFVTETDFDGIKYNLPKLTDYGANTQVFIDQVEEDALRCLLGNELYTDFIEGLEETYLLQKWTDLEQGKAFVFHGKSLVWVGMNKMLTPLVYSKILEFTYRKQTGVTTALSKTENAEAITSNHDIVRGHNDFVTISKTLQMFLEANEEDYEVDTDCCVEYRNIFGL
jgi:hypothetical protein